MVTPNSRRLRRHHRRLLCRRLHLPLRLLPRLAPVEGGHRQATDQKGLSRGVPVIFCSCPNGMGTPNLYRERGQGSRKACFVSRANIPEPMGNKTHLRRQIRNGGI